MESIEDTTQQQLRAVADGGDVDSKVAADLKKRKLVAPESWTTFRLSKGPKFAPREEEGPDGPHRRHAAEVRRLRAASTGVCCAELVSKVPDAAGYIMLTAA